MRNKKKKYPKPQKKQYFESRTKYQEIASEELIDSYGKPLNSHNNYFTLSDQPFSLNDNITNKMFYASRRYKLGI